MDLRLYQIDAIERVRAQLRRGALRVLLCAPTGAGKTVIASDIILRAYQRGKRVLFFAHRRELIDQTYRKLFAAGVPAEAIGVIMSTDRRRNDSAPIQVASIDTFRHRDPPPADLVIIDEAHRSLSQSYLNMIEHYVGGAIIGMTATPFRGDGGGLGSIYKALEVVTTPRQLIDEGFLAEPRIFAAAQKPDLRGVRVRGGDYVEADLAEACGKLVGNIVEHWRRHANGMRTVAFAVSVAHSQAIVASFLAAGVAAEHLDGTTPTPERDAILGRLERGETLVVSNCNVLCEGYDQPAVKCAILGRPTQSTGLYLQQAGRILRPFEGIVPIILDHAGNTLMHGLPQDTREFSLDTARPKKSDRVEPKARECPECGAVLARGAQECPECGATFEREPIKIDSEGELIELDTAWRRHMQARWAELTELWRSRNQARLEIGGQPMKRGWIAKRFFDEFGCRPPKGCKLPHDMATADEKAEALEQLQQTAQERGYKPGWASFRFKERFGHWPERARGAA